MNTSPSATKLVPAREITEGAGVTVHRTIGTPALRKLDPFLLLDHMSSDVPDDYVAGFPPHPHRGFTTFSYIIDGDMEHRDSMGNTGSLGPGGAQWMKAASGVIHSEMPKQENGLLRGFQLWINLPAANKMDAPEYQEYRAGAFPVVDTGEARVKILIGEYAGQASPITDDITHTCYLDVQLAAGKTFRLDAAAGHNSFLYVFEGDGRLGEQAVPLHHLATLPGESEHDFIAGQQGARFIVVSGKPLGEPVVQYGPFVMNTQAEIDQAMHDYRENTFIRERARVNRTHKGDS